MTNVKQPLSRARFVAAALCFSGFLFAQPAIAQQQGGPRQPPQAALDACQSLSSGAECSFTGKSETVSGTCAAPEGKPLACRPAGGPPGGGGDDTRKQKQ